MSFQNWYNASINKPIDVDGAFGDQCVDVAMSWAQYLYPGHGWPELLGYGNAKDLFGTSNAAYFNKVNDRPAHPGDMVVFGPTPTNPYGHIAVVRSADNSYMQVIEQNGFNPSGVAYNAQRPYNNVIGLLRPKILEGSQDVKIENADNWYHRMNKLAVQLMNREITRPEFEQNFVGNEAWKMVEIMSDNQEAGVASSVQHIGNLAIAEKWPEQIATYKKDAEFATGVANTRGDRLNQLAKLLGAKDSDDFDTMKTKVEELKNTQGGGISPEDSAAIKETNSIVKWIKDLLGRVFK